MKRFSVVRVLNNSMLEGDIGIFIGNAIGKEAYTHHREGNIYLDEYENMLSLGLGIALCTDKKVFIFCDDAYFLRNLSEATHIAVSGCTNVCIVILVSGLYGSSKGYPTIYNSIRSPQGILFNMGFTTHNYTRHFKNIKNPTKEIKSIWAKLRGPLSVVIDVDKGTHKNIVNSLPAENDIQNISNFIKDDKIPSNKYTPPISVEDIFGKGE